MKRTKALRAWPKAHKPAKHMDEYTPKPRTPALSAAMDQPITPAPKQAHVRDQDYLRWVASLPCAHCGIEGRTQAAHSDDNGAGGKGIGIKACDTTAYPACGPTPLDPGCHWRIGSSGTETKAARRALEAIYSAQTRAAWELLAGRPIG
jgi:hypothetical protein